MYQQNPNYVPPVPTVMPQNSTMAIVSLISGIASWILLPFIGAIVAVITGHMAKSEIKRSMGTLGGNGMATAGLVLGYLNIALSVCAVCVVFILPLLGVTLFSIPFFNTPSN